MLWGIAHAPSTERARALLRLKLLAAPIRAHMPVSLGMLNDLVVQVKFILSPKQRAKPAASRTRTCTNAAVCIASGSGCGKAVKSYFGFCKAGHIQPSLLQCRECKLLVQSNQQYCPRALTHGCQGQPPFLPTPPSGAARMSATVKRMWQDLVTPRSSTVVAFAAPTTGSSWGQGSAGSPADWGFQGF